MGRRDGMSKRVSLVVVVILVATMFAVNAQEKEEPKNYIYATYYECNVTGQWLADAIAEMLWKPVMDAAVDEGMIKAWGWLAHHTGGKWRRVEYFTAPTLDALLDAQEKIGNAISERNANADREFGEVCSAHDDYIWQDVVGGGSDDGRGDVGFSVYYYCDMVKEERADEIVRDVIGPVYDRHLAEGNIDSWGWARHIVGGKWRRLATMTGKDHKSLLKARATIIEELGGEQNEAALNEFSTICSSHQDYMWDIQLEKP
jgi:hypothetical protein